MELELVNYKLLKKRAAECPPLTSPHAIETIEAMVDRMVKSKAVGISAPQVGIDSRLFIMNPTGLLKDRRLCINPHILDHGTEIVKSREGCINYPERIFFTIDRFAVIDVEYITIKEDEGFVLVQETLKRWPAIVFQHLMEYLDGEDNQVIKLLEERDANKQENTSDASVQEVVKEAENQATKTEETK